MMLGFTVSLLLLFAAPLTILAIKDGLLDNGEFELGPESSHMNGTQIIGAHSLPNWNISGYVEYIKSGQKQGDMLLVVPTGNYAVRLGNEALIKQTVQLTTGMYYSLTFSAARTCAQQEKLNVSVSPEFGVIPMQTLYSSNGWDSYAWGWQAKYEIVTIVIHNPGVDEDPACGPIIDSVSIKQLFPPKRTSKNVLKNGDLEEGPYVNPNSNQGVLIPSNLEDEHCPLPGWTVVSLKAVKYIDSQHFTVPQGSRAVELVAGRESAIMQVVPTYVGHTYALGFAVGDANDACEGSMEVEAYAGDGSIKVSYESKGNGGSKRALLKFNATLARTRVVFFSSYYHTRRDDNSTLCGPVVDDVSLVGIKHPRRLMF